MRRRRCAPNRLEPRIQIGMSSPSPGMARTRRPARPAADRPSARRRRAGIRVGIALRGCGEARLRRGLVACQAPGMSAEVDPAREQRYASIPNCSAICSGEWLGSIESRRRPIRIVEVAVTAMMRGLTEVATLATHQHRMMLGRSRSGDSRAVRHARRASRALRSASAALPAFEDRREVDERTRGSAPPMGRPRSALPASEAVA